MPALIAVIGAGTMGAGIAQLALEHGHPVTLVDVAPGAVGRARAAIEERVTRRLARRGLAGAELSGTVAETLDRLRLAADPQAVAEAAVVIEAVVEDLAVKRALFEGLDRILASDAILATNTSALSVAAIGSAAVGHSERFLGLHFFNPAPAMPLVEVVAAPATAPDVLEVASELVRTWGRTPILCADRPGFIVNRVNRPFTIQALRALEAGVATVAAIDAAVRADGFPLGPFELIDLIGVDVNLAVATAIWAAFEQAERFRPSPIQAALVADGQLGRKAGLGFYRYDPAGARIGPAPRFDSEPIVGSDRAASVVERIRASILAEATIALAEGVAADAATIDLALRLGAGHPQGPFEWAAARGRSESSPTIGR